MELIKPASVAKVSQNRAEAQKNETTTRAEESASILARISSAGEFAVIIVRGHSLSGVRENDQ